MSDTQVLDFEALSVTNWDVPPARFYVMLRDEFFQMKSLSLTPVTVSHCPGEQGAVMSAIPRVTLEEDAGLYGIQRIKGCEYISARDPWCYLILGYDDPRFLSDDHPLQQHKEVKKQLHKTAAKLVERNQGGDGTADFLKVQSEVPNVPAGEAGKKQHNELIDAICKLAGYETDDDTKKKLLIYMSCTFDAMMALMYGSAMILPKTVRTKAASNFGKITDHEGQLVFSYSKVVTMDAYDMVTQHPQLYDDEKDDEPDDDDENDEGQEDRHMSRAKMTEKFFHDVNTGLYTLPDAPFVRSPVVSQMMYNWVLFVFAGTQINVSDLKKVIYLFDFNFQQQKMFEMPEERDDSNTTVSKFKTIWKSRHHIVASHQRLTAAANFIYLLKSYQDAPSTFNAKHWPTPNNVMEEFIRLKSHIPFKKENDCDEDLENLLMKGMKSEITCQRATIMVTMTSTLTSAAVDHSARLVTDDQRVFTIGVANKGGASIGEKKNTEFKSFEPFERPREKGKGGPLPMKGTSISDRVFRACGYNVHLAYQALNDIEIFETDIDPKLAAYNRLCQKCRPADGSDLNLDDITKRARDALCSCIMLPNKVAEVASQTVDDMWVEDGVPSIYPVKIPPYFTVQAETDFEEGKKKSIEEKREEMRKKPFILLKDHLEEILDDAMMTELGDCIQSRSAKFATNSVKSVASMHLPLLDGNLAIHNALKDKKNDGVANALARMTELLRCAQSAANKWINIAHNKAASRQSDPKPKSGMLVSLSPHATAYLGPTMQALHLDTMLKDCDVDARRCHGLILCEQPSASYCYVKQKLNAITLGTQNTPFVFKKVEMKNCFRQALNDKWDISKKQCKDMSISYPRDMSLKMRVTKDFKATKPTSSTSSYPGESPSVSGYGMRGISVIQSLKENRMRAAAHSDSMEVPVGEDQQHRHDETDEEVDEEDQAEEYNIDYKTTGPFTSTKPWTLTVGQACAMESEIGKGDQYYYIGKQRKLNPFNEMDPVMANPLNPNVKQYLLFIIKHAQKLKLALINCDTLADVVNLLIKEHVIRSQSQVHALYKLQQLFSLVGLPGGRSFTHELEPATYFFNTRLIWAMPSVHKNFLNYDIITPYIYFLTAGKGMPVIGKKGLVPILPKAVVAMDGAFAMADKCPLIMCRVNHQIFETTFNKAVMSRNTIMGLTRKDLMAINLLKVENRDEKKEKSWLRLPVLAIDMSDWSHRFNPAKNKHELSITLSSEDILDEMLCDDKNQERDKETLEKFALGFYSYINDKTLDTGGIGEEEMYEIVMTKICQINPYLEDMVLDITNEVKHMISDNVSSSPIKVNKRKGDSQPPDITKQAKYN